MKNRRGPSLLFTNVLVILMFCALIGFTTMVQLGIKDFQNSLYKIHYNGVVPEPSDIEEALKVILPVEGKESIESLITGRELFTPNTSGYGNWYLTFSYDKIPGRYPDPTMGDINYYFQLYKGSKGVVTLYIPKESWKKVQEGQYEATVSFTNMDILLTLKYYGNDPKDWKTLGDVTLK